MDLFAHNFRVIPGLTTVVNLVSEEECDGVILDGRVQYLTNEERIRIIESPNSRDFDVLPEDFEGPRTKTRETLKRVPVNHPFYVIEEWDGTRELVKMKFTRKDGPVLLEYQDGVVHCVSMEYAIHLSIGNAHESLNGKKYDTQISGTMSQH